MHQHTAVSLSAERARMPLKQCASEYVAEIPIAVALSTTRRVDHVVWHSVGALVPTVGVHSTPLVLPDHTHTLREAAACCCARTHTHTPIYIHRTPRASVFHADAISSPQCARTNSRRRGYFFLCAGLFRERDPLDSRRETRRGTARIYFRHLFILVTFV